MSSNPSDSATFTSVDQQLMRVSDLLQQMRNFLQQTRSAAIPPLIYEGINQLAGAMLQIHNQVNVLEEERRSLRGLAQVGQLVNSSLDVNEVLQVVMDTIINLTGAERGFLMLKNEEGELVTSVARNWEQETLDPSEAMISRTIIYRVANTGQPVLTTNAQEDPRFTGQQSIIAYNLRSIMCSPLMVKNVLIGVIYVDHRIRTGLFSSKDVDIISAFTNQAAVAIDNATLFASVKKTLAEVTELKNLMDNVLASIASGVLTADIQERILLCNRAAETILGLTSQTAVGRGLVEIVPPLAPILESSLREVIRTDQQVLGLEASPHLPMRGQVDLRFSLSPLKDAQQNTQGVAIVLEDLTEKKTLEAQSRLFERMVSPQVIRQLDPDRLQLGGRRAEITILFADIRGFTSFSEEQAPESLVAILNRYLAAAADAVLSEEGTVDKFLGDAVMAWYNAPILQADHTLRAVRSALTIRKLVNALHQNVPPSHRLSFGVGIHVGEAVLGLVGTEKRLDYTAIGDCVNTAKRIQENALPGQILITRDAYQLVSSAVVASPVEPIQAKGKREAIEVLEILCMR